MYIMFKICSLIYLRDWEYTLFHGECTTLNVIWRSDRKKELLPDHFTAILQLALGLEYLHSQKLIHGDIKPENVVIWNSGTEITLKWANFESPLQSESKRNIEKGIKQMSDFEKEFHVNETKFFMSKESRTWLAPELQTLSNPQYLATFESDVFAAGLVFGSLLLNGAHPFGLNKDEITSNIKMNNPVNVGSKSLLFQDFISYALPL